MTSRTSNPHLEQFRIFGTSPFVGLAWASTHHALNVLPEQTAIIHHINSFVVGAALVAVLEQPQGLPLRRRQNRGNIEGR